MIHLISYPRSGNHLTRFIIEYISCRPTHGCIGGHSDTYICAKQFENPNLLHHVKMSDPPIVYKSHIIPETIGKKVIIIIRDPFECITRHKKKRFIIEGENSLHTYMTLIDYYHKFDGDKLLIYYEDLIKTPHIIAKKLFNFLELSNDIYLNKFVDNHKRIILESKRCISNIPPPEYVKLFPDIKNEINNIDNIPQAYKNISRNKIKYHSKHVSSKMRDKSILYVNNHFSFLIKYVKRYL